MSRKLLAILMGLLIAASLVACSSEKDPNNDNDTGKTTESSTESDGTGVETDENGSEIGTSNVPSEIGDPGEYDYTECDQTVYVNNPESAVTLRSAEYEALGSVPHGTELRRIGLSTDDNYWSKVIYEEKEYYVASKFLTTLKNPDEGFADVEKTVVVNDKTGALNIRNIPSMESTIIGHANAGVEIKVIAENTATGWYKIEFVNANEETVTGYIASDIEYFVVESTSETTSETESVVESASETASETTSETAGK